MKITDSRKDGQIPCNRIFHGRCFEFDGHFYMRVRLASTYASVKVPENHIAAVNLRAGGIRALHGNTLVRAICASVNVIEGGTVNVDFGDKPLADKKATPEDDEDMQ